MNTKRAPRLISKATAVLFLLALLLLAGAYFLFWRNAELVRRFDSPDGHYRIEIWRDFAQLTLMAAPGSGSDTPGEARLIRNRDQKLLGRQRIEMVQLADHAQWEPDEVRGHLIAEWHLEP